MPLQFTPYFAILGFTALLAAGVAAIAWQRRSTTTRNVFALMMVAITFYATVAALEAAAIPISAKVFWSKLEYVGSGSTIVLFFLFTLYFTHHQGWLTRRRMVWLWVVPCLNALLAITNDWHHLVWLTFLPGPQDSNLIIYRHGPGFYWVMVWVYCYVLSGVLLLVQAVLYPARLYRYQAALVLLGALVPLVGGTVYMLRLTPPGLNITPMSFLVTGLVFFASLFHFRMFDLLPIARDMLVERMGDGVLVLDQQFRIVDINPAAQQILGQSQRWIGQDSQRVLAPWPDLIDFCHQWQDASREVLIDGPTPCYMDLRLSLLYDFRGQITGRLVVLRDVTQRHLAEVALRQTNARLQQQIVENEALQLKLEEQAIRDRLTGLFNRHYFDETVPKELARAVRGGYPVAFILLDLDYFKSINDTFGHRGGDLVLQTFANLLVGQIRTGDLACRFGGEEFVLVLPWMPSYYAYQRAERIRTTLQDLRIKWDGLEIAATVSGGIALFPEDGTTQDDLLQVADRALYAAKAAGRNRIQLGHGSVGG